jgi:hypothetical protein
MAEVDRLDVSEHKDVLPEELSGFDALVRTESPKYLYGEDSEGNRTRITDMGGVILHFAAKATGEQVERIAEPAKAGGSKEKAPTAGIDIEALVNRMVEERVRQALAGREEKEKEMQAEIDKLKKEIERLQKPLNQRLDEDFGENWVPREEGIAVARRGNDGYMDEGWTTDGQPFEKDGKWYIKIKKEDNQEEAELTSLIRVQESPPADDTTDEVEEGTTLPANVPEGSRQVYRRRGWFGRRWDQVRGRPVRNEVPTGIYSPPEGGYVRVVEDEVVEVPPSEVEGRDGTARALGAAALVGVGALAVWELLEHKYIGHSPTRELRHNGVYPWGHFKGIPNHHLGDHDVIGGGHGLGNGTHTDFFNPAPEHRRTAVEASQTIHLTGNPGDKTLKDGNHVILRHVQWTKEGLLSKLDRMRLRDKGYHVEWGKLQDTAKGIFRYKSVVSR